MRAAREAFAKACPPSPKIWVDWITEERKHIETDDDKAFIFHLYQRALADFQSVDLWRNYLNCTSKEMDKMEVEAKREIFEQAVSTMGLHLTKGAKLWELYRQFELSLLSPGAGLQAKERIDQLFRRRLAVPLVGMEKTMAAYLEFLGKDGSINAKLMTDYNKALEMLKARETMETTIKDYASRIKTDIFDKYIALEKSEGGEGSHQRICVLFERQVIDADFSRTPESIGWIKYLDYLDKVPNAGKQYLAVYKRALRNHPNNPGICFNYMAALEAAGEPMEKITEAFEWLKSMNFTEATKYTELWMAYLECYHRNTVFTNEDGSVNQEKAEEFRGIFKSAHEFLSAKEGSDPQKNGAEVLGPGRSARLEKLPRGQRTLVHQNFRQIQHGGQDVAGVCPTGRGVWQGGEPAADPEESPRKCQAGWRCRHCRCLVDLREVQRRLGLPEIGQVEN